jgi:hypothetical protein
MMNVVDSKDECVSVCEWQNKNQKCWETESEEPLLCVS